MYIRNLTPVLFILASILSPTVAIFGINLGKGSGSKGLPRSLGKIKPNGEWSQTGVPIFHDEGKIRETTYHDKNNNKRVEYVNGEMKQTINLYYKGDETQVALSVYDTQKNEKTWTDLMNPKARRST